MDFPHYQGVPKDSRDWFEALSERARYLRTPEGCPWDRVQTTKDFARFALGVRVRVAVEAVGTRLIAAVVGAVKGNVHAAVWSLCSENLAAARCPAADSHRVR